MASAFGHAAGAIAISQLFKLKTNLSAGIIGFGVICSILPDIDIIAFKFGIPYESMWGHRGITHSIFFAVILAIVSGYFLSRSKKQFYASSLFIFLATFSHSLLDAMTTGGKGVAFFAPFDNSRYFLPWRVIKVSPIGLKNFLSEWGVSVLLSEFFWIGIPLITSFILLKIIKTNKQ
ncbi:MAG: inner membrane protein [Chitinophagales bacterium]|jgi:inner membrane protein